LIVFVIAVGDGGRWLVDAIFAPSIKQLAH
jgi:hypothetical protein